MNIQTYPTGVLLPDLGLDTLGQTTILTHLSQSNLDLLTKYPDHDFYLSLDLFMLLQKLTRLGILATYPSNMKTLPLGYPTTIGPYTVTALASDNGYLGAIALILEKDSQKIGYLPSFLPQGIHKTRIKKLKKHLNAAQLDILLIAQSMATEQPGLNYKQLTKYFTTQLATASSFAAYPYSPELLLRLDDLAQKQGHPLNWQPDFQAYLQAFDLYHDFSSVGQLEQVSQADLTLGYDLNLTATMTPAELREVVHVIAAQKTIYF
ncbi:MAG: hypothetical protein MJ140_01330 [Ligilactobacillus sp.]|nr:hypothetical protein [Ligilactobacillus sp.]